MDGASGDVLTPGDLQPFASDGYLVLPRYLPDDWNRRLVDGLDRLAVTHPGEKRLMPHQPFLDLLTADLLHALVRPVLGDTYLFHHANGKRIDNGAGKVWHHDYDSDRPWDGAPGTMMVHVMIYPAGIAADGGPLVLRPGSHTRAVSRRHANAQGYEITPGDVVVTGGSGLVAVVNSALWHMRPPLPTGRPRYYLNFSFIGPDRTTRPERETYRDLFATLPDAARPGDRDLVRELCGSRR